VKLAFFGSPAFALPVLDALLEHHEIVLVAAQPSKPAGRGLKLTPPPVAARAVALGLPLVQPAKLRNNAEFEGLLRDSGAAVAITCAYGKILPAGLLGVPRHGFLNVHTSLLPKYRGAAPIQWALIQGETETGVTIMQTDVGLDTGPILLQDHLEIAPTETALELAPRLSKMGARLLVDALEQIDTLPRIPQDDALHTLAPLLEKDNGRVHWTHPTREIYNRYRGVAGWPGSFALHHNRLLKIHAMQVVNASGAPGEVLHVSDAGGVTVATADGAVELIEVQPEGKPRMSASQWARGYGVQLGTRLE
jgi:methionyl-tRNA formyltransferase